jgi:hypothetical protein
LILMLLTCTAIAATAPDKPTASVPVPGQCTRAIPVKPGYTADCRGVLLPTSWMADYDQIASYNEMLRELYRIDTDALEYKLQYTEEMLEEARKPVPFWDKHAFWVGMGIVAGGAITVAGGYAMVAGVRQ